MLTSEAVRLFEIGLGPWTSIDALRGEVRVDVDADFCELMPCFGGVGYV